ncbi:polysaccharide deacetylase family protein [Phosphitispora sp. TUW77]|uniref:polysaccharide deacetylase family protein n=1 Tax=Phosphitispora sp. TUW77 TaxID=3152361 RepID=UPI003AB385A4
MGKKTLIIVLVFLLSALYQGCAAKKHDGAAGFSYLIQESKAMSEQMAGSITEQKNNGSQNHGEKIPYCEMTVNPENKSGGAASDRKKVYLTFDDGPDGVVTPLILDTLDSYGIKATFFVVGTQIEKYPEVLQDMFERGHSIGNHTYSHRYNDIYSGRDSFMESIRRNEEIIFHLTGNRPKIFRDPGGSVRNSESAKSFLADNGYQLINWNVESYDSRKPRLPASEIIEKIRQQTLKEEVWSEMVIIMHDGTGHIATARALPTIIHMLQNQGFQFEAF